MIKSPAALAVGDFISRNRQAGDDVGRGNAAPLPDRFPQDWKPLYILLPYCTVIFSTLQAGIRRERPLSVFWISWNACFVTQSGSSKVLCAVMVP